MTDMNGYFIKDGLYISIEYNKMIGNYMVYKYEKYSVHTLDTVTKWVKLVFTRMKDGLTN